jgi:hypothetical protein
LADYPLVSVKEKTMHTKDMLAQALREVGLNELADKAATGYYHDYLSPLELPEIVLVNRLIIAATEAPAERAKAIHDLRQRVINGDFDASAEEAEEWAASPEGEATMRSIMGKHWATDPEAEAAMRRVMGWDKDKKEEK